MIDRPLTATAYNQYRNDMLDLSLNAVWGLEQAAKEAQERLQTEINFNTTDNPPQVVPVGVVTYLTGKYQWTFTTTSPTPQTRRITKIVLI